MKDKLISVRIPDDLRDRIRAQARAEGVTMSAYVRRLISDIVAATRPMR
ncbi:BrnA antitoxin family protein [Mycobacterium sp. SMC-8]|nr:BrnA antitoxin family protein [Mycobacterium sp. SMC-8]